MPKTISAHTLGCKVNQYDTERMLELFRKAGYHVLPYGQATDVVLINTCTVTGVSATKSMKTLRHVHKEHPQAALIAAGCLAQQAADKLSQIPGVRLVIGARERADVVSLLGKAMQQAEPLVQTGDLADAPFEDGFADAPEERTRAVLKIQEGCHNKCAYCIIPSVRGPVRSRSIESIREQVQILAQRGYREIVLTGIHLNAYGLDLGLSMVDGIEAACLAAPEVRFRLGSLEPTPRDAQLMAQLAKLPNLCPHFHLALQSGCDATLGRMRRRYNTKMFEASAQLLRQHFPGCALTTDMITGFPGETDEEFAQSYAFAKKIGFSKIHAFPFSSREGTVAATMGDQVPLRVRKERALALIALSGEMEEAYLQSKLGKPLSVIFEKMDEDGFATGHSPCYCKCAAKNVPLGQPVEFVAKKIIDGVLYAE